MKLAHIIRLIVFVGVNIMSGVIVHAEPAKSDKSAYDFTFESLDGNALPLSNYQGKVLLIVNTASRCGFTPQYKGLEALYEKYKERGLIIIGVPSNDFGEQEPGDSAEIKQFCALNYGVTFPMTTRQIVSGDDANPFYKWIHGVLGFGSGPKWNFHKYLIDTKGNPVDYFSSITTPDSPKLIAAIERLLPTK